MDKQGKVGKDDERKRGKEGLVRKCEEVLRGTKKRARVGKREGNDSWIRREVRRGCPLSPTLFILLLADLVEEIRRER